MRALTGTGRISSGYWVVNGLRNSVRMVTIIPLAIPVPNKRDPLSVEQWLHKPSTVFRCLQGEFYTRRLLYYKGLVKEITESVRAPRHAAEAQLR